MWGRSATKLFENIRSIATAGLAKEAQLVNP